MKKQLSPLAIISALSVCSSIQLAQADTLFGIHAGAGVWQTSYSGEAGDPALTTQELGVGENNNNFYYLAIEHPIPLLPNIKLQQNNLSSRQTATIERSFNLGGTDFAVNEDVTTDFDLGYTDASLYYEILDNWLNLDLGVTLRQYSGYMQAESSSEKDQVDLDIKAPLVYAKFQFDLPFSGFSAGFEGNYMSYNKNTLADYSAKVSYMFDSVMDLGLELGYKQTSIMVDEDDTKGDLQLKGPYAAAIFHF
jgi:outer membrane protein